MELKALDKSGLWSAISTSITASNSNIKVSTDVLVAQADTVRGLCSDMTAHFDNIKTIMDKTKGYWLGEAGDLHRQTYEEQIENIQLMLRRLKEHPDDLLAIAKNYDAGERKNVESADGLPTDVFL